jgi:hypothetical protein
MFGNVGEAWRRLLVDFGLCGALAALSIFMNCDRQLGGLSDGGAQVSGGGAGRGKSEFRDPCGQLPNRDHCHEPPVGRVAFEMLRLHLVEYPDLLMVPQVVELECR